MRGRMALTPSTSFKVRATSETFITLTEPISGAAILSTPLDRENTTDHDLRPPCGSGALDRSTTDFSMTWPWTFRPKHASQSLRGRNSYGGIMLVPDRSSASREHLLDASPREKIAIDPACRGVPPTYGRSPQKVAQFAPPKAGSPSAPRSAALRMARVSIWEGWVRADHLLGGTGGCLSRAGTAHLLVVIRLVVMPTTELQGRQLPDVVDRLLVEARPQHRVIVRIGEIPLERAVAKCEHLDRRQIVGRQRQRVVAVLGIADPAG